MARPREVFVSHSSRDVGSAARLVQALRDHGVKAFYSPHSIRGAQEWHAEIGAALRRCDWFLVVLTPAAVRSKWVGWELVYALKSRRYRERIVPLLFRNCNYERLSWTFAAIQHVDFRSDFDAGCRELCRVWNITAP